MEFHIDHRENAKLHALYVGYAYEELKILRDCCEELSDLSRVTASITAGAIMEQVQRLIQEDAAFFEAAALLFGHLQLPMTEGKDNGTFPD